MSHEATAYVFPRKWLSTHAKWLCTLNDFEPPMGSFTPWYLPLANVVCEGYVFTGVCLFTGGSAPVHAWRPPHQGGPPARETPLPRRPPARETPLQAHTQGGNWGGSDPGLHPRGKLRQNRSRPTPKDEIEGDQVQANIQGGNWGGSGPNLPPRWLMLRAVHILLECILVGIVKGGGGGVLESFPNGSPFGKSLFMKHFDDDPLDYTRRITKFNSGKKARNVFVLDTIVYISSSFYWRGSAGKTACYLYPCKQDKKLREITCTNCWGLKDQQAHTSDKTENHFCRI